MAVGYYTKQDGTKSYWIEYYINGRRKREFIKGADRKLAKARLRKTQVEIAEGRYLDKKKESKMLFKDFAEEYIKVYVSKLKSYRKRVNRVRFTCKTFGKYRLSEITTLMIESYQAKRLETIKPATSNRELAAIKSIFRKAIEWGYVSENPAKPIKFLKEENQRTRYLESEEKEHLLAESPEHLKPIIITAIHTGMRKGELRPLTWDQVDFQANCIRLTKTKSSKPRDIPMTSRLIQTLMGLRANRFRGEHVFRSFRDKGGFDFGKCFEAAIKRAGIEDFTFHDLRHTFAAHYLMSGGDIGSLREILGHSDLKTTQRYSHFAKGYKQQAIKNFGKHMETNTRQNTIEPVDTQPSTPLQSGEWVGTQVAKGGGL
ncbi:tyrosine-type recombinase/integrase [Acidobacteriota bacterium]